MADTLLCHYSKSDAQMIMPYLEKAGHHVKHIKGVDEAFECLSQSPEDYDLVFAHVILSGGHSWDLIHRCAEYAPTAHIPFLILTAVPNEAESYAEWEARAVKYEFLENGRDAWVAAVISQEQYILPAIQALPDRQATQPKIATE